LYLPLKVHGKVVGVLGIHIAERKVNLEEWRLIEAWASMAAIAVERIQLAEMAKQAAVLVESERLHTALFNSISHEIRTPLSTIIGSISSLLDPDIKLLQSIQYELMQNIREAAIRMERVASNLLDTARLESGSVKVKNDWCDIGDIVGAALYRLRDSIQGREIQTDIPQSIPLLRGDCVLLEQVMVNLLDNALKYSRAGSDIEISASSEDAKILVSVADRGIGIPEEELQHIFQKFYRTDSTKNISGTGLGLSICKGLIEAHGGTIWALNRPNGGARISFALPLGDNTSHNRES
jgi:two-component system sensor histidine kinase KdpD